jgi:hypothetical protein
MIIFTFPESFIDFGRKQFSVLWDGGSDGFSHVRFHSQCDRHSNTLAIILDTNGNVFDRLLKLEKITSRTFSQQLDLIFITSINLDGKEC